MFETLAGKIVSGILSLSFLLFSSYEGNDASFRTPLVEVQEAYASCRTELVGAFEKDFNDIFRCGEEIILTFDITITGPNNQMHKESVVHKLKYFSMKDIYQLTIDSDNSVQYFDTLNEGLDIFSRYDRQLPLPRGDKCQIKIVARLNKLWFASQKKEFDLNLLWKNKLPEVIINIDMVDVK
jgi:hypothetical protein